MLVVPLPSVPGRIHHRRTLDNLLVIRRGRRRPATPTGRPQPSLMIPLCLLCLGNRVVEFLIGDDAVPQRATPGEGYVPRAAVSVEECRREGIRRGERLWHRKGGDGGLDTARGGYSTTRDRMRIAFVFVLY